MRNDQDKNATQIADLKRVDEIIKRATGLWIGLLGALVFASVTLAGVKDIAFFNPKVGTQLPFTGVAVPVVYFFYGGSLLIAVVYIYLHIYLEQLWDILGKAPALVDGRTLSERLHPWLVADFALRWRDRLRKTPKHQRAAQRRALSSIADFAAVLLVWLFTPAVLVWFWWRSMPAHDPWMTGLIGACLLATMYVGVGAYASARVSLKRPQGKLLNPHRSALCVTGLLLPFLVIVTTFRVGIDPPAFAKVKLKDVNDKEFFEFSTSWSWDDFIIHRFCFLEETSNKDGVKATNTNLRTKSKYFWEPEFCSLTANDEGKIRSSDTFILDEEGQFVSRRLAVLPSWLLLAPAQLFAEVISEKQKDWLGFDFIKAEFREKWCTKVSNINNNHICNSKLPTSDSIFVNLEIAKNFNDEWANRRQALVSAMPKIDFKEKDLRQANFRSAHLEGVNFERAKLGDIDFTDARLESAKFMKSNLRGALLRKARLEGADFSKAYVVDANLQQADLNSANFNSAYLSGSYIGFANFEHADLSNAILNSVNGRFGKFNFAKLYSTSFEDGKLKSATFNYAYLERANFKRADLQRSSFVNADLSNADFEDAIIKSTKFMGAKITNSKFLRAKIAFANFQYANLHSAQIFGSVDSIIDGQDLYLEGARLTFSGLRYISLNQRKLSEVVDFDTTFADKTADIPLTTPRPCQWVDIELTEKEFLSRWKGWREANGESVYDLENIEATKPPTYCVPVADRRDRSPPPSLHIVSP